MNLAHALRLDALSASNQTVSLAGAGGKTTALFQLARQLTPPLIVTSTTHLGIWQIPLADHHIVAESPAPIEAMEHGMRGITLITGLVEGERTNPLSETLLIWLREHCAYHDLPLLIEADGARQKPLKAPGEHEPAIPLFTDHSIYVAGLSGLGQPLTDEFVHRPEIFARLSGLNTGDLITPDALVRVLTHPQGGLKNIPPASKRTLILNQADTADSQSRAGSMSPALLEHFDSVIVTSLNRQSEIVNQKPALPAPVPQAQVSPVEGSQVHAVHENTAGIILAAGESTRFGRPKQLLDWRGEPFVRAVAKTALAAGLSPVIVVTGANAGQVENAVRDLDVKIVRNEEWRQGQSTSIKAGISHLTPSQPPPNPTTGIHDVNEKVKFSDLGEVPARAVGVGAAIFLLADQPHVGVDVIRALMEVHARELSPIVAPLVLEERRANPVLFDRVTFQDLLQLEGDIGGRAIFSKYRVEYMPWHDDRLLLDVDKPEDYQRLVDDETL